MSILCVRVDMCTCYVLLSMVGATCCDVVLGWLRFDFYLTWAKIIDDEHLTGWKQVDQRLIDTELLAS